MRAHISLGLDGDDDDITLPPGVPPGADIEFSGFTFNPISGYYSGSVDDEPAQFFGTELVASTLCPVSTNVDANVYMEWKLPTDTAWETIGKATWTWGGDLSYAQGNFTVNGGIIGVTGVSSNEEPKNPGPCGGE